MFTEAQLAELAERYPNLTTDEIRHKARQVERKDREEGLNDPLAYLNSALHHMSQRQPRSRPHDEASKAPKARGSFRVDGSWDERLAVASDTETALREFAATVIRLRLSPFDAVSVLEQLPLVRACYRSGPWLPDNEHDTRTGGPVGVMLRLDARPLPVQHGLTYERGPWLDAAWAGVHTSTSAEEFAKRSMLRALAPTA